MRYVVREVLRTAFLIPTGSVLGGVLEAKGQGGAVTEEMTT